MRFQEGVFQQPKPCVDPRQRPLGRHGLAHEARVVGILSTVTFVRGEAQKSTDEESADESDRNGPVPEVKIAQARAIHPPEAGSGGHHPPSLSVVPMPVCHPCQRFFFQEDEKRTGKSHSE